MLDFSGVRVLSFDCYGTLVDWESGILSALRPLLTRKEEARHGEDLPDIKLLELYGRLEREAQAQSPFINYKAVLQSVVEGLAANLGLSMGSQAKNTLVDSLGDWPLFPDTTTALRALKSRFKLAIISNVDDDLFQLTQSRLGVPFDWVITSEQLGSYKPSPENFQSAMRTMDVIPAHHVHVAQSLYHDIGTAHAMGLKTVWINRKGAASTPVVNSQPDLEVPDLQSLAALVNQAGQSQGDGRA